MSDKYVVFRVQDWDKFIQHLSLAKHSEYNQWSSTDILEDLLPDPVPDAEVFRHHDIVSAPILYAASSIYRSYVELLGGSLTEAQRLYMDDVVEHFFEAAEKAQGLPTHKLPD